MKRYAVFAHVSYDSEGYDKSSSFYFFRQSFSSFKTAWDFVTDNAFAWYEIVDIKKESIVAKGELNYGEENYRPNGVRYWAPEFARIIFPNLPKMTFWQNINFRAERKCMKLMNKGHSNANKPGSLQIKLNWRDTLLLKFWSKIEFNTREIGRKKEPEVYMIKVVKNWDLTEAWELYKFLPSINEYIKVS